MDKWMGREGEDSLFPEDWLASVTLANNGPHEQHPKEGLSRVLDDNGKPGQYFIDLLKKHPVEMTGNADGKVNVLCKLLDAAERLAIQCHPDKQFAEAHYNCPNGKTESWAILATRQINGEKPYILMGFKPDIDPGQFKRAAMRQDVATMLSTLHKVCVEPGDIYFVPGRLPHAIGGGVLLLEIQEPTDWVVQLERFRCDTELTDKELWGPLSPEIGLECFDYSTAGTLEEVLDKVKVIPRLKTEYSGGKVFEVFGPSITDCFKVDLLEVDGEVILEKDCYYITIVTAGKGRLFANRKGYDLRRGTTMFLPTALKHVRFSTDKNLSVYLVTGGE